MEARERASERELLVKRSLDALGLIADCHPELPAFHRHLQEFPFTYSLNSDFMAAYFSVAVVYTVPVSLAFKRSQKYIQFVFGKCR